MVDIQKIFRKIHLLYGSLFTYLYTYIEFMQAECNHGNNVNEISITVL